MSLDYISKRDKKIVDEFLPKPVIKGDGLLNSLIDNLPMPLHIPGYNYAGPGTPLDLYLEKGVKPCNKLDEAARKHDIAYSKSSDLKDRHEADYVLQEEAWKRVKAPDASVGEKACSWLVTTAMKAKRALGAGVRKTKYIDYPANLDEEDLEKLRKALDKGTGAVVTFRCNRTKESISDEPQIPLSAKQIQRVKSHHSKTKDVVVRLTADQLKNAKTVEGGFLGDLLIPIVTSGINAYNNKKANDRLVEERIRHNKAMETLTTPSKGDGVYINKKGDGVYINKKGDGVYINKKVEKGDGVGKTSNVTGNGLYQELLKKKKSL